ncbi:hypothetical protein JCM10213v2_003642 [Rhodosporidiobolus nylandii]
MASNETGECCVCGKETANRCGACAEADFGLFFCSRAHQKLIWPAHKRVCGPGRCNPFLWPDLTKDEAEEAKKHLRERRSPDGLALPNLTTYFTQTTPFSAIPADHLPATLDELCAPSTLHPSSLMTLRPLFLVSLRFCKGLHREQLEPPTQPLPLAVVAFRKLAILDEGVFADPKPSQIASLPSPIWHLFLITATLSWIEEKEPSAEVQQQHKYAARRVLRYIEDELFLTHPKEALAMVANMRKLVGY